LLLLNNGVINLLYLGDLVDSMGLFHAPGKKETKAVKGIAPPTMAMELTDVVRRLRMMEERQENLRKKMQMIEQNMLTMQKKFLTEFKTVNLDLTDMNAKLEDFGEKIVMLIKEIKLSAKKEDIDVVKKYLDYWTPVKFVTIDNVEEIVKDVLEEKGL